jgi:hypothetical protein
MTGPANYTLEDIESGKKLPEQLTSCKGTILRERKIERRSTE